MGEINGVFIYNGNPQNGATAKLWKVTGFVSYADSGDTVQDDPLAATSIELNVSAGTNFDVGDVIRIENENLLVFHIATNKLYVIRGYQETTPAEHANAIQIDDQTIAAPGQDDNEPDAGYQQGASVTTGVTYGGDGAYRWTGVPEGEYYASAYYDGHRAWLHCFVERDDPTLQQILRTGGDLPFHDGQTVTRLPKDADGKYLALSAGKPAWSTGTGDTKELFVPATFGSIDNFYGAYPVKRCNIANPHAYMCFMAPLDFSSISSAQIIVIPRATQGAANWDIESDYAAAGEAYNTHHESDSASTYEVADNQLFAIDVSGILSGLAAGDFVGIKLTQSTTGHDVDVLGLRLKYA